MHRNVERLIVGAALGLAASALLPILKPLVAAGANRVKYSMQFLREEVEDIVAEAQFERMKKRLDREIMAVDPER